MTIQRKVHKSHGVQWPEMFEKCATLLQTTFAYKKFAFIPSKVCHLNFVRFASTSKKSTSNRNYYETLGLTPEATPQEIKTAYYTLCKQFHPDITNEKDFEKAAVTFLMIGEAYECLSNKESRAEYDKRMGIFGPVGDGDFGARIRTQRDIERDLKAYAQFRRDWRGKSASGSSYGDPFGQTFYASYQKTAKNRTNTNNHNNNNYNANDRNNQRYDYSQKDFENFYKTFKKRVSMDREYEDAAARDPHLHHFRTQRSFHENPDQKEAKNFYDNLERNYRQAPLLAMFIGALMIVLVALRFLESS